MNENKIVKKSIYNKIMLHDVIVVRGNFFLGEGAEPSLPEKIFRQHPEKTANLT